MINDFLKFYYFIIFLCRLQDTTCLSLQEFIDFKENLLYKGIATI